ncbi:hypothetical protein BD410DRAFT_795637 [Rickenella mellea]|uniref:Uncharacterized protein n=1 Tax=Rickenella mellea TaxID=50990 RepID=A0A4Y7PNJ4_9AGAM|nr:hypothetical protein BD410DRAFT_795637 [Rickenella mellea]
MSDSTKTNTNFKELTIGASIGAIVERVVADVKDLEAKQTEINASLRGQISDLKALLKAIGPLFPPADHPAALRDFYDKELTVTTSIFAKARERKTSAESQLKALKSDIENLENQLPGLQREVTENTERLQKLKMEEEELRKAQKGKVAVSLGATETQRPGNIPSSERAAAPKGHES